MIWKILSRSELNVSLPHSLNHQTIYPLITQVLNSDLDAKCQKINFDFSRLNFVEPSGVTTFCNLIEFLKTIGASSKFSNHDNLQKPSIRYLDDSGFFKKYLGKYLFPTATVRPTTLPLNLVHYEDSYQYIGFNLTPWLANSLSCSTLGLATLKVCFYEIFNNIKDHSARSIGCSYAQHYPTKKSIEIGISDFGIGIPKNVRTKIAEISDHRAIEQACQAGFTTQTTPRNRGAGLDVLISNVVARNSGVITIQSGGGIVNFVRDGTVVKRSPKPAPGFYPGTLIRLKMDTEKFIPDEDEEHFEW